MWDKAGLRGTPARFCGCGADARCQLQLLWDDLSEKCHGISQFCKTDDSVCQFLILPPLFKAVSLLLPRKKAAPNHLPRFPWELLQWEVLLQSLLVYLCCEWCFLLYLLISNSLMDNRLDNGNRWKKSSACVSLTNYWHGSQPAPFCWMVELGFLWPWNCLLKTWVLMREKMLQEAFVQWAHTLYLFRADILTDPLPGVSWKTTSKEMFCYLLTFF